MRLQSSFLLSLLAKTLAQTSAPSVTLDNATVIGSMSGSVKQFLGIPFAKPPTGGLRLNLPVAVDAYEGTIDATTFGPACPQQVGTPRNESGLPEETRQLLASTAGPTIVGQEDCLNLNVVAPNISSDDPLPVVAWIFGGGFEFGAIEAYNGSVIVERSIAMGQPIIFVAMNYRLSVFGFLAGKEIKEAGVGNLGLYDQRLALRWIQKYIGAFGGDPSKVTLWGHSAGAISVASQMLINGGDTEGLFRGAFMQSGSVMPVGSIENGQTYYDAIVDETGCAQAKDTLECLRKLPFNDLKGAADSRTPTFWTNESLRLAYTPRTDGTMFLEDQQRLVEEGKLANIPVVSGNCDDEGTEFSLSQPNVLTNDDVKAYLHDILFPQIPVLDIGTMLELYPETPSAGSPFGTGDANVLTPQFKRLAALQGDLFFHGPRRFLLSALAKKQDKIYTYISKRQKSVPYLGSFHGTDLFFNSLSPSGGQLQDYLIRFVATLDPNGDTEITWPKWDPVSRKILSFNDGDVPVNITEDSYRKREIEVMNRILYKYPL